MLAIHEKRPLRILVLFSDTGGGHRSAAEALLDAWREEHPGRVQADMVDVLHDHTSFPFNRSGPLYSWMLAHCRWGYKAAYRLTDSPRRATAFAVASYPIVRRRLLRLLRKHPADVIVSVHPLVNHVVTWAMRRLDLHLPYITVVTDLLTANAFWFYPHVTHLIVPTEGARTLGIRHGVPAERITVRGLPVARQFTEDRDRLDNSSMRAKLGLRAEGRIVLLIGGGDGMGPVEETAHAIDTALADMPSPPQLVVVTGRNAALRERLENATWRIPVRIEGFVRNMPEWMAAADVLLTKAGPGTITEGMLSGLPMILFGKVPGQEDGNVDYVVQGGAGAWEPVPVQAAARLREWLNPGNAQLQEMAARAITLADPTAASRIATDVLDIAERYLPIVAASA